MASPNTGAVAAYKGYKAQELYCLWHILKENDSQLSFKFEHIEDFTVEKNGVTLESIQVKYYSKELSLSDFSPGNKDGFFSRALNLLKKQSAKVKIISFGKAGSELRGCFIEKDKIHIEAVSKKLKKHYSVTDVAALLGNMELCELDITKLEAEIENELVGFTQISLNPKAAFDFLRYKMNECSSKSLSLTKTDIIEYLNHIGQIVTEAEDYCVHFGTSIKPLKILITNEPNVDKGKLKDEFYLGVSARIDHIINNVDIIREDKIEAIKNLLEHNNTCIIHGASGQGKSALSYRALVELYPLETIYKIERVATIEEIYQQVNAVKNIYNKIDIPIILFYDVDPGNTLWNEWVKETYYNFTNNIKTIISVREEDYNRANIHGGIKFGEIHLTFNKEEAQKIYNSLCTKHSENKYKDFEEAWRQHEESYPALLEFVYSVTQTDTLKNRLTGQINNMRNALMKEEVKSEEVLRLFSFITQYSCDIDYIKQYQGFGSSCGIKRILDYLKGEYLIYENKQKGTVESFHPLRSKIIYEILQEPLVYTPENLIIEGLTIIKEESIGQFLLYYAYDYISLTKNIVEKLLCLKITTWNTAASILESLLWAGINSYVKEKRWLFDELNTDLGNGMITLLPLDLSGLLKGENTNLPIVLRLDFFPEGTKETAKKCMDKLSDRNKIYDFASEWLNRIEVSTINLPVTDDDCSGLGKFLYWHGLLNGNKLQDINTNGLIKYLTSQQLSFYSLAHFILGLFIYQKNFKIQGFDNFRNSLVERIRRKYNIIYFADTLDEITWTAIIPLDGKTDVKFEDSNNPNHALVMDINQNLFSYIFPDRKKINSSGIGHIFINKIMGVPHDDTVKHIPLTNMPNAWIAREINRVFLNLIEYEYKPATWKEVEEVIADLSRESYSVLMKIWMVMEQYFKKDYTLTELDNMLDGKEYKGLCMKLTTFRPTLPKVASDKFGRKNLESRSENNDNQKGQTNSDSYEKIASSFREYISTHHALFYPMYAELFRLVQMRLILKNKAPTEALDIDTANKLNFIDINLSEKFDICAGKLDNGQKKMSNMRFGDCFNAIQHFKNICESELPNSFVSNRCFDDELNILKNIWGCFEEFMNTNRFIFKRNIGYEMNEKYKNLIRQIHSRFTANFNNNIYTYDRKNKVVFFQVDAPDDINALSTQYEEIILRIKDMLKDIEYWSYDCHVVKSEFSDLLMVPLHYNHIFNPIFIKVVNINHLLLQSIDEINPVLAIYKEVELSKLQNRGCNLENLSVSERIVSDIKNQFVETHKAEILDSKQYALADDIGIQIANEYFKNL